MACRLRLLSALVLLWLTPFALRAQLHEGKPLVQASLVADTSAILPGRAFQIGLLLEMAPGWHTYWEYSGDAGLPTRIDWDLPPGFRASPIAWPVPEATLEPGDIQTYAYSGSVLLLTTITPPAELPPTVTLRAKASWLVCGGLCIPGDATLEFTLPVAQAATPENAALFEKFRARLPSRAPPPYALLWQRTDDILQLNVSGVPDSEPLALFPLPSPTQAAGHPRFVPPATLVVTTSGPFSGVLAVGEGAERRAWFVSDSAPAAASLSLWLALIYGFLGGMILNLMPCVLPVISLKIFGFIKQAGASRWSIFSHGLAFMAGIFFWFLGLAAVIIALKSGGSEVTWAFQFQNPWFNVAIGAVVFVFALNLLGVFEIVLPGRAANALASSSLSSGLGGSFFQGVFATLLATPCTAPFLGTALGFAFSQSAAVIVAMFASVAFGMALPYLLLTAQPGWMRLLPRPGAWMEQLKQFMAFPLFATLIWILNILSGQRGAESVVWFTAFLLCLAFACWLYGSFCGPLSSRWQRVAILCLVVASAAGGGWYFLGEKFARSGEISSDALHWVPFSEARVLAERAAGNSVFVDFTADWCITCKFNERTAIDTPGIRALLAEIHVVAIKANWTNANPEITAALKRFGRVGVPFYVIYPAGDGTPIVLPEILTEALFAEALRSLP